MVAVIQKMFTDQEIKKMDNIKIEGNTIARDIDGNVYIYVEEKGVTPKKYILISEPTRKAQFNKLLDVTLCNWDNIPEDEYDLTPEEIKEFKNSMVNYPTALKEIFVSTWLQINAAKKEKLFTVSNPEELGIAIAEELHNAGVNISTDMTIPMAVRNKIFLFLDSMMKRREEYNDEEHQQQLENIEKTGTLDGSGTKGGSGGSSECGAGCYVGAGVGLVLAGAALWWGYNNFLGDQYTDEPIILSDDF